jgi:hypothetical protein
MKTKHMTTRHLRKSTNRSPLRRGFILIPTVLVCLGLWPKAYAVTPAPDGGYGNFTTAEGQNALLHLTTGANNTAVGWSSLGFVTTGSANTALGTATLLFNTADNNTATGAAALLHNIAGGDNTANGAFTLLNNTTGGANTGIGFQALFSNNGFSNTGIGFQALFNNTTGNNNTATGAGALLANAADDNTATGASALVSNTTGTDNTANGALALFFNTAGSDNTAVGFAALENNNTSGHDNTANGVEALYSNTMGSYNTAIGVHALASNTTGTGNVALGIYAGANLTTGGGNIDIANGGVAGESNKIRIGIVGDQNGTFIAGISGQTVAGGVTVIVDANGHLGTVVSSARFKEAIKPMDNASEAILALKPVTFRYKHELDPDAIPQFGLIAEQVEKVNPALVARDAEGKVNTVRYEAVNAMLLNEFLKEHRKIEEQEASITQLKSKVAQQENDFQAIATQQQKQIAALTAGLQKVSAQVEMDRPAPLMVLSNR